MKGLWNNQLIYLQNIIEPIMIDPCAIVEGEEA